MNELGCNRQVWRLALVIALILVLDFGIKTLDRTLVIVKYKKILCCGKLFT